MAPTKLPTKNLLLILIFGGGILVFLLLSIFPNYVAYSSISHEINTLKNTIEEQKILSPIFEDLSKKAEFVEPDNLPFPEKEKLSKNKMDHIPSIIQKIVQSNDFELDGLVADVGSITEESEAFKVSVKIIGEFSNLRSLLLHLGTLPYLAHIEKVRIHNYNGRNKILLNLWFAQEQ